MAHLSRQEARKAIMNLSDQALMKLMDSVEVDYSYVNGVLIDRENIIGRLIGECAECQSQVTITYSGNGKRTEVKKEPKQGCKTCG